MVLKCSHSQCAELEPKHDRCLYGIRDKWPQPAPADLKEDCVHNFRVATLEGLREFTPVALKMLMFWIENYGSLRKSTQTGSLVELLRFSCLTCSHANVSCTEVI